MSAMTLLPCPFCGGKATFEPYKRDGLTLKCESPGCAKFSQRTLRQSIEWLQGKMTDHWNTRAHLTQPAQSVDVEKVREVIEEIAEQWHGCMYDAPGETIDISDAIRRAGTRLITAALQEKG